MTPNELYAKRPLFVSKDLNLLKSFDEPVVSEVDLLCHKIEKKKNQRIDIVYYVFQERTIESYDETDGDWIIERLAAIKFDGKFVMFFLMEGSGGENINRFITDKALYDTMADYMKTLLPADAREDGEKKQANGFDSRGAIVELGANIEDLEAYGWLKSQEEDDQVGEDDWLEHCVNDEVPF